MQTVSDKNDDKFVRTGIQRTAKYAYIGVSVISIAVGLLLMIFPSFLFNALAVVCGTLMLILGAVKLVGFFSKDLYRLAFQYDFALGVLLIAVGLITILRPSRITDIICVIFGIAVLVDGLFKLQTAVQAKRFGIRYWWLIMLSACAAAILGILLVIRPTAGKEALTILLGATLLAEGILSLCTALAAIRIIRHQRPEVIETTAADPDEK